MMNKVFLKLVFLIALSVPTLAQEVKNNSAQSPLGISSESKEPVEISAGKTLEWHQKDKQYVADGRC